jgi:hypothetical protein
MVIVDGTRPKECELQPETGPCRAMFQSFYFNPSKNRCEEFIYGGCSGMKNEKSDSYHRFLYSRQCKSVCNRRRMFNSMPRK